MTEHNMTDLNSRIDRIEVTLNHAVEAIEKMARVVNKPTDTKWGPILTAVSLLFVAGSGYTTLITMPLYERIAILEEDQDDQIERELFNARDLGRIEGALGLNIEHD